MKAVVIAATTAAALISAPALADGKATYEASCKACHDQAVAGAPKFGDKAAWAPRIATGEAAMVKTVITGKGAMPPKAGNAALTEDQIKAAVQYMVKAAK